MSSFIFCCSVYVSYLSRRSVYLGPVDPVRLMPLSEGVWAVTLYDLALEGVASPTQVEVFIVSLLLWWATWWVLGIRWGPAYRRAITCFWQRIVDIPRGAAIRLILLYLLGLVVLLAVTLASGGGGDNRLAVLKLVRPVESITTLLVPVILFRLLIATTGQSKLLLVIVLVAMIITGGKSSVFALLVPVTGAALVGRITLRLRTLVTLGVVALSGFAMSVTLNYGATEPLEVFSLLYRRISLDGDVYLLSLPNDLLGQTVTTSLATYLLGPLIKVFFLPIHVDTSIGAQIGSLIRGEDTVNGPNPHWPIVLLAYHRSVLSTLWLSLACFATLLWVKLKIVTRSRSRRWPLWFSIPFHAFVLLFPQTFFADPSFPVIYLVQAFVLAMALFFVLRRVSPCKLSNPAGPAGFYVNSPLRSGADQR